MFCPNCGKKIDGNPDRCPFCGKQRTGAAGAGGPDGKKAAKPKLVAPLVSCFTALAVLCSSVAFLLWDTGSLADAETAPPQQAEDTSGPTPPRYRIDEIMKEEPDSSALDGLAGDSEAAAQAGAEIQQIEQAIALAEAEVAAEYPNVTEETVSYYLNAVRSAAYELYRQDLIVDYEVNEACIRMDLPGGGSYIYAPRIAGCDAGGGDLPDLYVATYQPCLAGYDASISAQMQLVDAGAALIDSTFDTYSFSRTGGAQDADYDDTEVSAEACVQLGKYNVALWHGHGAYDGTYGSLLVIGTERNAENDQKYQKALRSGEMFYSQDCYLIGSEFVDSYVPDGSLEHTLLYLGACSSGKDSRLAQAFLNKGAEAVYANSGIIHTVYNLSMINGVAEGLCQTYEGGGFYTVSDALDYAKDKHGAHDTGQYRDTEVRLFTENQSFALDWYEDFILTEREVVLVLDTSGSMNGTPLSETKKAAENFIETVLKEDASIGLVTYASQAEQKSGFSRKQYMLTEAVDRMDAGGSTNIDGALQTAAAMLEDSEAQKKLIVLMSDGVPNVGREGDALIQYADEIRDGGVYIYTLGFFNALSGSEKAEAQRLLDGIADEGCHYEVEDADDLVFFFGDIAAQINGQKYIYVKIACPVDVIVSYGGEELNSGERRLNTRTSYGSLSFEENDSSADGEDDPAKVLRLKEGAAYEIRIEGTGRGRMDYTIGFMDDEGSYSDFRKFENIRISRDTVIDTVAAVQKQTELRVDEDGDGRYDLTYRAGENERGEQVSYTPLYIAGGVAAASGLALLISLLVLISRIKKRLALRKAYA